ncbi:MAG: TonB-dependent receptor [Saprospiraceae bacterium]|nr:MAG: TonB-dependent receptor [Saprospiraceae bacterium]
MQSKICILVGLLVGFVQVARSQSGPTAGPYVGRFEHAPLEQALQYFEEKYRLSFSYDPALVAPLRVTAHFTEEKLDEALRKLLADTQLDFEILPGGYVLLTPRPERNPPEKAKRLCGTVLDEETNQPLAGAVAYLPGTPYGSSTDAEGRFELEGAFRDADTLVVGFLGYETQRMAVRALLDRPCRTWRLRVAPLTMPDVLVREFSMDMVQLEADGSLSLRNDRLPTLPGWGEPDVLRSLQFLPGINSAEGLASRLYVRGGTPDQNLILWQGISVYHTGHFFGLYDAFNPYVVNEARIWRGGFGAYYGGRNSAVVSIDAEPAYGGRARFGVGLNLLHLNAYWEKPLAKDRMTILAAFRTSYVELIRSTSYRSLFNSVFQNGRITLQEAYQDQSEYVTWSPTFSYNDMHVVLRWKGRRGADNQLSLLSGSDEFDYRFSYDNGKDLAATHDHLSAGNIGLSWQHRARWSDHFDVDYQLAASGYANDYFFLWNTRRDLPYDFRWRTENRMGEFQARFHHNWQVAPNHRFSFGYQLTTHRASLLYADTNSVQGVGHVFLDDTTEQVLHTFYGEFAYQPSQKWRFTLGVRENHMPSRGLYFSEPRIGFTWNPFDKRFSLKGGAGRYWQFVFQIQQFGDLGVGEPLWGLATSEIPAQELWQWNLGATWQTTSLLIDLDCYVRKNRNLTTLNLSLDTGGEKPWVFDGTSRAVGLDLLLRKRWTNYGIWLSWSMGKVTQQFLSLNGGNPFPAPHDIRHNLDLVHMFKWKRWELSINMHFNSGRPFSQPVAVQVPCPGCTVSPFSWELHYPTLYQRRLPASSRFDVGASYRFQGRRRMRGKVGLALYNLLDNRQILDRDFVLETAPTNKPQDEYKIQTLTRRASGATPNLFVQFEW